MESRFHHEFAAQPAPNEAKFPQAPFPDVWRREEYGGGALLVLPAVYPEEYGGGGGSVPAGGMKSGL